MFVFRGLITPLLGRFSEMNEVLNNAGIQKNSLDGILIDAGCSSMQMDSASRGFSISKNGPLDMRMDGSRYVTLLICLHMFQLYSPRFL